MTVGVVYVLLVWLLIAVPPVGTVYQRYCPLVPPVALSVAVDGLQTVAPVVVGADGRGFMVAVTAVLMLSQVPLFTAT